VRDDDGFLTAVPVFCEKWRLSPFSLLGVVADNSMKDETWGEIAWWITTIFVWTFKVVGVLALVQFAMILLGMHVAIWNLIPWRRH
jgi:hypothetical protein